MPKYCVSYTLVYNHAMEVDATDEDDAVELVRQDAEPADDFLVDDVTEIEGDDE